MAKKEQKAQDTAAQTPAQEPAPQARAQAAPKPAGPSRLELVEAKLNVLEGRVAELEKKIEQGIKGGGGGPKPKFGGTRQATPTKDTKTGNLFESKSACAKAVAEEFGLDPDNHFAWYELIKVAPDRFVPCNEQEAEVVAKMKAAREEKEAAELQAKIDAEEKGQK